MCDEIYCLSNPEVISTYCYWYHLYPFIPTIMTQFLVILLSLIISLIFGYGISHCFLISCIISSLMHDLLPHDIFQLRSMVKILSFLLVVRYFHEKNLTFPETSFFVLEEAQTCCRSPGTRVIYSSHIN